MTPLGYDPLLFRPHLDNPSTKEILQRQQEFKNQRFFYSPYIRIYAKNTEMFVTVKTDLKQLNVVPIAKIHFKFAASNFYNLCVQDGSFLRSCLKHIPVRHI